MLDSAAIRDLALNVNILNIIPLLLILFQDNRLWI
jgi:hypothetical protein